MELVDITETRTDARPNVEVWEVVDAALARMPVVSDNFLPSLTFEGVIIG